MPNLERSVGIYTLGCKVNQYESEAIAERFLARGFLVQSPSQSCDVYVINTCTVTAESDRKAGQFIRRAIHKNPNAYILVTGCFSQTSPDRVCAIKGVDYVTGNADKLSVVEVAEQLLAQGKKNEDPLVRHTAPDACGFEKMEITRFDRTRAYVKIEDGCENRCSYCIIPHARGRVRSKAPDDVLKEVSLLTAGGCREIVLTGIETASYGRDLENYDLAKLLCEIDKIPNLGRIRLGSLDPSLMKQAFVDKIASLRSLAPHFHVSLQSADDETLAAMRRKYTAQMALDGMERLRRAFPDVQFTTDVIVGFPGETNEAFEKTLDFVKRARFLMIHVFPYSKREGTVAAQMDGQIPSEVKRERVRLLSELEKSIRREILAQQVGRRVEVLFETFENGRMYGHTPNFIEVVCPTAEPLDGQVRQVQILGVENDCCVATILPQ